MKRNILLQGIIILSLLLNLLACSDKRNNQDRSLQEKLYTLIDTLPGTVGIAFVSDKDTVTINNGVHFPMMSVFKLHQALAVVDVLKRNNSCIDSVLHVIKSELDPETWSPMLKEYGVQDFDISVRNLIKYALTVSDNNASNLLFKHIVSPKETDAYIRKLTDDTKFQIRYSEAEMKQNHILAYHNYTSPLSAANLIKQVFDSELSECASLDSIRKDLSTVSTGQDRLGSILHEHTDLFYAHKTGSGYRNEAGELAAHNDVGYFRFPDGREYALAVFIRDFADSEAEASAIIAKISHIVYEHFNPKHNNL